ncbi:MAG TPA: TPM domain-containing protein [Longimicrobiales bacterium]|nr:TPM domain-containing protein [Longimicrobiales bacterium]
MVPSQGSSGLIRVAVLAGAVGLGIGGLIGFMRYRAVVAATPAPADQVDDRASLLPPEYRERLGWYLGDIRRESGIDIRMLFASPPEGEALERFAAESATRLGIGRGNGTLRGILVVYDPAAQRLRVEVGYGLEAYFPDAFIGYLIEKHVRSFFAAGDPTTGLRLMVRILHERIRDEMLGGRFDPAPLLRRPGARYGSGGGGASGAAPLRADPKAFLADDDGFRGDLPPALKARFTPQPTPDAAYQRYREWLETGRYDPRVELFTPASRAYLLRLPMTPPYFDHILMLESGRSYRVVERGDLAMLYFTDTPLLSPKFLRRDSAGWRLDLIQEVRNSRERVGWRFTWSLVQGGEAYDRFADLFVDVGEGTIRVGDGDNRPLPSLASGPVAVTPVPLPRRLPDSLLAPPAPPARDEFGYATPAVDKRELVRLLRRRDFSALEDILGAAERDAQRDFHLELAAAEAFDAFARPEPELQPLLDEWVGRNPTSTEALVARGNYHLRRAWTSRGEDLLSRTPRDSVRKMERWAALALRDYAEAVRRDPRHLGAYEGLIYVLQLWGAEAQARDVLAQALRASPYSYLARVAMMAVLRPEWGGSLEAMDGLARQADRYAGVNPRLRVLHGFADRTRSHQRRLARDWDGAIAAATRSLAFGESWGARQDRAEALYRAGRYEEALADLNRALRTVPQDDDALEWRAYTLLKLAGSSRYDQREQLLQQAERDAALAVELRPTPERERLLAEVRACPTPGCR